MKQHLEDLWVKYENGTMTEEEQAELEKHIDECRTCKDRLQQLLAEEEPVQKAPPAIKQSLRRAKWKQRLANVATTLGVLLTLYLLSAFATTLYYAGNNADTQKAIHIPSLAVQAMMPNVRIEGTSSNARAFFGLHTSAEATKQIGKDRVRIGTVESDLLFSFMREIDVKWTGDQYEKQLLFVHPRQRLEGNVTDATKEVWAALEKLPEGTVAEVSLSFDQSYTAKEVRESLLYGIYGGLETTPAPVWFALDTGLEGTPSDPDKYIPYLGDFDLFGFPDSLYLGYDDSGASEEDSVLQMMQLFADNESAVKKVPYVDHEELRLQERYEYVKKHGVHVYGVVVTGPTKELLKLKDAKFIRFASLGKTALWNWIDRPAQGTLF